MGVCLHHRADGVAVTGAKETQALDYDPHCRRCEVPLMAGNARTSRGRFVGVCRPCESEEVRERKIAQGLMSGKRRHGGAVRKYPVPVDGAR